MPNQRHHRPAGATTVTARLVQFERWYAKHLRADGAGHVGTAEITATLRQLFALSDGRLLTPSAPVLEAVVTAVDTDERLAERMPEAVDALEHYLDFAIESGTWAPSDEELDRCDAVLAAAFDLGAGLLLQLLDALDDVDDVPEPAERRALAALRPPLRSAETLYETVTGTLLDELVGAQPSGDGADLSPVHALALGRAIGVLCVAAHPVLLPGLSAAQVAQRLDTASGVSEADSVAAVPPTERMLAALATTGAIVPVTVEAGVRWEAPEGLRAALADTIVELAEEVGLLEPEEPLNPHPEGAVLRVRAVVSGSRPAVWRELRVGAEADLGEVHLALQLALDWTDELAHRFEAGGGREAVEVVAAEDELEVEFGEFLVEARDELGYRYGEGSEGTLVTVTLLGVDEAGGERLPRCVGASPEVAVAEVDELLAPLRLR
ncbi:plasmid pRiA4b ORF-3 family protein [Herbiconiux moechotypicola]|uniref:Plasmid pRiA4b Orf3-like domain-containing protein n=1 Tax=Herbiconiux moechotypicola TaxID=637393 RepID=A0ABN3D625_9MICO|nr:plasmid pRiA4b ORF-3 family protein [Herbiconiux moechotypicola]MCS5728664.1 plasmid pRiA4b ORF-3 family protein [Herbiconiux moechotypicola]